MLETGADGVCEGEVGAEHADEKVHGHVLEGLDDIGLTMEKGTSIDSFEAARADDKPWL